MCGLAGLVSLTDAPADRAAVAAMVRRLQHRGPDAETVHLDGPVGFGHARLSIIDLPGGGQPLFNEDRSVAVICNGEIYNYRELRRQLQQRGHRFTTDSDCEVLVHLWEESGRQMVADLRGMYACVVYDRRQGVVFAARDPFGQKPLFYHLGAETLAFASEMKAFRARCRKSLENWTSRPSMSFCDPRLSPARARCSGVSIVCRPVAGSRSDSKVEASPRVHSPREFQKHHVTRWIAQHHTRNILARVAAGVDEAVRSHLVADVPVGVFLSGGIDSSLITAIAARHVSEPLRTFAITFPGSRHDEGPKARLVAEACGTRHQEFPFSAHDLPAPLLAAARQLDQPLADTAVLPLMHLARETAREVKVVLTGDGGDELFAGYRKYRRLVGFPGRARWLHHAVSALCPPHHLSACAPDPTGSRQLRSRMLEMLAPVSRSAYHRQGWEGWERHALYQDDLATAVQESSHVIESTMLLDRNESLLSSALRLDQGPVLADRLLHKTDAATMAFGLEARAPLLDPHLAAIAAALPEELQVTAKTTKVALRKVAAQFLPVEIVAAPKKGFSMPLDSWLRNELRDFTRNCLLDDSVSVPRFFQRSQVERLLTAHAAGKNHAQRIYSLLVFELWCREAL